MKMMPSPASKYCVDNGGIVEVHTDPEGNQYGICVFPDESACEEWAYYDGECMICAAGAAHDEPKNNLFPIILLGLIGGIVILSAGMG